MINLKKIKEEFFDGIGVPEPSPFTPDEFQTKAIESLKAGSDTLVVAPTGSGKTYIAIEAIYNALRAGKRAVYTAPLKALSNTKYNEFKKLFEPEYKVGLLTGDRKIDTNGDVVIATTEIYRNDLYNFSKDFALVILDEFHYLSDSERGPVWEESVILSPKESALLMLSATISNAEEIASWIREIRNKEVNIIRHIERPVELRLGYIHPEYGVIPLYEYGGGVSRMVLETPPLERRRRFERGEYLDRRGGGQEGRGGGGGRERQSGENRNNNNNQKNNSGRGPGGRGR